jgi:hypothetical protein
LVVRHPVTPDANWVFQALEAPGKKYYFKGMKNALFLLGGVPAFILLLVFYACCWGFQPAILYSIYSAVYFIWLMELLFHTYRGVPFASEFDPTKPNLKVNWIFYVIGFMVGYMAFSTFGLTFFYNPSSFMYIVTPLFVMNTLFISSRYRNYETEDYKFVYDNDPEPDFIFG